MSDPRANAPFVGDHGWTTMGAPGRLLRRGRSGVEVQVPFSGLVDVLEPETEWSYAGTATFRGRAFGTFRLFLLDRELPS